MPFKNAVFEAFGDELQKIAGEMQGYTRLGRKPISIEKMLENEGNITGLPDEFVGEHMAQAAKALTKMSAAQMGKGKVMALLAAGGGGALVGRQMNEDRKIGRMVRKQQAAQQ